METLWPNAAYPGQIERLRHAVGHAVYLVELHPGAMQLGISLTDTPFILLDVLPFPRPDPARGLAPHYLLLDDGRGVNLGRIARASYKPFAPEAADILYQDIEATQNLLFAERRLSPAWLTERSRQILGMLLGKPPLLLEPPE